MEIIRKRDAVLILIAVAAAYGSTVGYGFVMDDFGVVANNPAIKSPANLLRIFVSPYLDTDSYMSLLYRPLDILSYMAEYAAFGIRPAVYHLDNIILHLACSFLVYLLAREFIPKGPAPLYAALLFAVQPAHTEAVAWISCRGELLSAAFTLITVLTFIISRRGRPRLVYVSYAAFFLGLLSKESAVVGPLLIVLYVAVFELPDRRSGLSKTAGSLAMYAVPLAVFLVMRGMAVGVMQPVNNEVFDGVSVYGRFLTMCHALFEYIRLCVLPTGQKVNYIFPPPDSLFGLKVLLPVTMVAALLAYTPVLIRGNRAGLFMAGWFLVALLPVSNIIPTSFIMAERVMYLPSVGACVLLGMAASWLTDRTSPKLAVAAVSAIVVMFTALTNSQARIWRDQDSYNDNIALMLKDDVKRNPGHIPLLKQRARILSHLLPNSPETDDAILESAAVAASDDAETRSMVAGVYFKRRNYEKALTEAVAAVKLSNSPNNYLLAGSILDRMGRFDDAVTMLDEAIRLRPTKDTYFVTRGTVLMEQGKEAEAVRDFEEAARLNPEVHNTSLELSLARMKTGGTAR